MSANKSRGERGTAAPFAGIVDVATISPQTRTGRTQATDTIVRVREQSAATISPRKCRVHELSMSATKHVLGQSAKRHRQRTLTIRSQSAVAYADRSRIGSERKPSLSANSPRSYSVHVNGCVHEQSISATKHGHGQSVNMQRQRARIIRRQSAIAWRSCA